MATIMENQASTITSMVKEAVQAVMSQTEGRLADELDIRMKEKEKIASTVFKHEGNSDQYKHQKDLWDNMAETDRAVKRGGGGGIKRALDLIDEGKKLVQKGMELIKIPNKKDWGTVKECMSDNLASDTDDEKALAKVIKATKERRRKFVANTSRHRRIRTRPNFQRPPSHRGYDAKQRSTCWSCGKLAHFQWQCFMQQ